jgi:site-specific recombinase XerD
MTMDFKELLGLCENELTEREYGKRLRDLRLEWGKLAQWMEDGGNRNFSESIGFEYCDETFGNHILTKQMDAKIRLGLRAVRMLTSYQKYGDFEFRSPRIERNYEGMLGVAIKSYLSYARDTLSLSDSTISNKEYYLYAFYKYMSARALTLDELGADSFDEFFSSEGYTLASRHNSGSALRIFLRYAYDTGFVAMDLSLLVLPDGYKKDCKLPTTYAESEIRDMLSEVERASAVGKRDYLILLLAAEYGWRSKDIVGLRLSQIDWEKNIISFAQSKTGTPVEYPLLASIGNAVIDYLRHGRIKTDSDVLILSAESARRGKPLTSPTIHSIVTKYMRKANLKDLESKKHGSHALRHSLATNMLQKNVPMPVISTVMGHQRTETTNIYMSIDVEKLRICALPMPEVRSPQYRMEVL